jgi:tRNA dimethylallyltransferase
VRVAVVGATASGKSQVAHEWARERGDVDIICVDAMTVYRQMDIGTAKPSRAERAEVSYFLLDMVDPHEEYSVAQFQRAAREVVANSTRAHRHVLYVGGTGLYGRAVIDDLEIPGQFPDIRDELERRSETELGELYEELRAADPLAASRIEPDNRRRIVRALEVVRGSGRAFSSFGEGLTSYGPTEVVQVGIERSLEESDARVERRFRQWVDDGLVDEVRALRAVPGGLSRTAAQAVGYREIAAYLDGAISLDAAIAGAIESTRKLLRRQRRWFRRDPRIRWFADGDSALDYLRHHAENLGD